MPFTRSQTEAVFTWAFTGEIDAETFRDWFTAMRQTSLESALPSIYHVLDVRAAHTDFGAILAQMRLSGQQPAPENLRQRTRFMLIGTDEMARLASSLLRLPQFGSVEMPIFRTPEDAAEYIRVDQEQQRVTE